MKIMETFNGFSMTMKAIIEWSKLKGMHGLSSRHIHGIKKHSGIIHWIDCLKVFVEW